MSSDESSVEVAEDRMSYAGGEWCDECDSPAAVTDCYCRYCGNQLREDDG